MTIDPEKMVKESSKEAWTGIYIGEVKIWAVCRPIMRGASCGILRFETVSTLGWQTAASLWRRISGLRLRCRSSSRLRMTLTEMILSKGRFWAQTVRVFRKQRDRMEF